MKKLCELQKLTFRNLYEREKMKKLIPVFLFIFFSLVVPTSADPNCWDPNEIEGFEAGWHGWTTDNGVWEVGEPTSGPGSAYAGTSVAATVLNGSYPGGTDSRLISPIVSLPTVQGDERVELRFW